MDNAETRIRIDKWLWAARFYKTRQLAIKALNSSQILLNKNALKPASLVQQGDVIMIKRGADERELAILGISSQRGPAKIAQTLYAETPASIEKRQKLREALAMQPSIDVDRRKPDRRRLRDSRAFKRGD